MPSNPGTPKASSRIGLTKLPNLQRSPRPNHQCHLAFAPLVCDSFVVKTHVENFDLLVTDDIDTELELDDALEEYKPRRGGVGKVSKALT
jgi:hypothetical protein